MFWLWNYKSLKAYYIYFCYILRSNHVEITENSQEYLQLPETMKNNCKGKTIFKADTEEISEKSFKSRKFSQFEILESNNSTRVQRQGCDKVMVSDSKFIQNLGK